MAKTVLKVLVVGLCLVMANVAYANGADKSEDSGGFFDELGINIFRHATLDDHDNNLDGFGFILSLGSSIAESDDVNLHFRLELGFMNFEGDATGQEIAISPGLRLYTFKGASLQPYFELGAGLVYNSTEIVGQGTEFNFLSYAGLGVRFQLSDEASFDLGGRVRHISNAGLDDRNGGLDSYMIMAAFSFAF